jgi:hypothetical protein
MGYLGPKKPSSVRHLRFWPHLQMGAKTEAKNRGEIPRLVGVVGGNESPGDGIADFRVFQLWNIGCRSSSERDDSMLIRSQIDNSIQTQSTFT